MNYLNSLNSFDTLTQFVQKLHNALKGRWVKKSVQVENAPNSIARFLDFVSFVQAESEEANSVFRLRSFGTKNSQSKVKTSAFNVNVLAKGNNSKLNNFASGACWFCEQKTHRPAECQKFHAEPVEKRFTFVKLSKLCHKCLSPNHRTPECKRKKPCEKCDCAKSFHHTLLHFPKSESKGKSSIVEVGTSTSECGKVGAFSSACKYKLSGPSVYLCVVPVTIEWQGKQTRTYAFLDQGSTHSFGDIGIVNELGITGRKQSISLQTLATPSKFYEGLSFDLNISDLKGKEKLNLSKVLSIDEIPIQPNAIPLNKDLFELSYCAYTM